MHEYDGRPISYGGGVNSTALVVMLALEGWRGPIVCSDTGAEWPETIAYLDTFRAWLEPHGLTLTVLGKADRDDVTARRHDLPEFCEHYSMIPLAGIRWCTQIFKVEPLRNWTTAHGYVFEDMLIGISAEEWHRQQGKERPLVDRGIDRDGCARIITEAGLEVPRKSGCWLCPFQRPSQWRELFQVHPHLFERAARMEEAASAKAGKRATLDPSGRVTLRQLAAGFEAQTEMWDWLDYYQPCMCRV